MSPSHQHPVSGGGGACPPRLALSWMTDVACCVAQAAIIGSVPASSLSQRDNKTEETLVELDVLIAERK